DGNPAPIALFTYNRPEQTLRTLQTLADNAFADESQLYVFCYGAQCEAETAAADEVRSLIRRREWCERVTVIERDANMTSARSIGSGVSTILAKHENIIVLEDDLELAPGFLEFMNHALYHYRNKPRIVQVSAYMWPVSLPGSPETCF